MATDFGFRAYDVERSTDPFVFISYKSEDYERVGVYARHLRDNGINVWYDEGLHSGVDWESYLMSVIEKPHCKAVLLFLSERVAQSTVIPLETTQARACKKPTVAVHLEPGLDIEQLLNKAIKIYVEQRQSVRAYLGTSESVCAEVLNAARNAMEGVQVTVHGRADELLNNAQVFLMNWKRSRNPEDISRAKGFFEQMTNNYPSDYRGWLWMALCECMPRVDSLESASVRLKKCSDYYSYIMTLGADDKASAEYTRAKSEMWREILKIMQQELGRCTDTASLGRFTAAAKSLENRFGHTEPQIKEEFVRIVDAARQKGEQINQQQAMKEKSICREEPVQCTWRSLSDSTVELAGHKGNGSALHIPEIVNGKTVVSVGSKAFQGNRNLTSVTIPDGVTMIGSWAFEGCVNLREVSVPRSMQQICFEAFMGCRELENIDLPYGLYSIGTGAFRGCAGLKTIRFPGSVKLVGDHVFTGCPDLTVYGSGKMFSKAKKCAHNSGVRFEATD